MREKLKFYLSQINHHAAQKRHGFLRFLSSHHSAQDHIVQDHAAQQQSILNKQNGLNKPLDNQTWIAKRYTPRLQQGFSLLEMLVVIGLLGIVALGATTIIVQDLDFERREETEARWNQLHDAIISQPNLYLNGSPYIRGYVADMGRLPVGINELISQAPTYDDDDNDATAEVLIPYDEDDDAGTADITINQPDWQAINLGYTACSLSPPPCTPGAVYTDEIQGGWRGPYLYTAGSREFRDGWGREEVDLEQDLVNFGWFFDTGGEQRAEVLDLVVQSLGSDQDFGGEGDFTEDFPEDLGQMIVSENEWMLSAAPITFNINFSNAIRDAAAAVATPPQTLPPNGVDGNPQELELRIYRYVDDGDNTADINDILAVSADATFTVINGSSAASATITPQEADFAAGVPGMPIGRYAALIWCTNNNNTPLVAPGVNDDTVYDGDCNLNNPLTLIEHSPVYFTLTNNTSQVTLTWDLP